MAAAMSGMGYNEYEKPLDLTGKYYVVRYPTDNNPYYIDVEVVSKQNVIFRTERNEKDGTQTKLAYVRSDMVFKSVKVVFGPATYEISNEKKKEYEMKLDYANLIRKKNEVRKRGDVSQKWFVVRYQKKPNDADMVFSVVQGKDLIYAINSKEKKRTLEEVFVPDGPVRRVGCIVYRARNFNDALNNLDNTKRRCLEKMLMFETRVKSTNIASGKEWLLLLHCTSKTNVHFGILNVNQTVVVEQNLYADIIVFFKDANGKVRDAIIVKRSFDYMQLKALLKRLRTDQEHEFLQEQIADERMKENIKKEIDRMEMHMRKEMCLIENAGERVARAEIKFYNNLDKANICIPEHINVD